MLVHLMVIIITKVGNSMYNRKKRKKNLIAIQIQKTKDTDIDIVKDMFSQ